MSKKTMNFWGKQKDIISFVIVGMVIIGLLVWIRDVVNNNEGLVMVIVTTFLVLTTMYYSLLNRRLLENNQLLLAATDSPKVILAIRPWNRGKKQYVFVIENVGTGIASNIKLKMLGNYPLMLNSELDLMAACAEIKPISPKQDYKLLIETETWEPKDRKMSFDIEVSYTNSQRTKLPPEKFSLSIEASHHYLQGDLVAERLGEIADHIKVIANQSSSTNTTDSLPTLDEQEEQERIAQAMQEEQERIAQAMQEEQEQIAQAMQEEQEEQERIAQAMQEEQEARGRSGL